MVSNAFKSYDIRGLYPSEINEQLAAVAARAFAFLMRTDKVVIGRDARASSPSIHAAVVEALLDHGVDVYDIGLCPSPLLNYAVATTGIPTGIMITASHNPPEYNALKLIRDGIQISSPGDLDEVKKLVEHPELITKRGVRGQSKSIDVLSGYVQELVTKFPNLSGIKVVVDDSNGMGSITAEPVFKRLGVNVDYLNKDINLVTPRHGINPLEEKNLDELRGAELREQAALGICYDGDADRVMFIDDLGNPIYADIFTALMIPQELQGRSEKRVYYDLRFSKIVEDVLKQERGQGIMMRVGNPYYKKKLKMEGGVMAAELSGHIMFQDHYCIDDGLYASLKLMSLLAKTGKTLSELVRPLKKYYASPELDFKVDDADSVIARARQKFKDGQSIEIDGVYIRYTDWWFNIRKSNTEPLVRLRLEANSPEKLMEKTRVLMDLINSHPKQ